MQMETFSARLPTKEHGKPGAAAPPILLSNDKLPFGICEGNAPPNLLTSALIYLILL